MSSQIKAVIDVGTNSVKLLIAEVDGLSVFPQKETSVQTRLGQGFYQTRELQTDAIERTLSGISEYVDEAARYNAQSLQIIATSAVREAKNSGGFVDAVHGATGIHLRVVSGDEEAGLVFRGVSSGGDGGQGESLIVDVGGGSTEVILGSDGHAKIHQSIQLGTVRLMEQFVLSDPPTKTEFDACRRLVTTKLTNHFLPIFGGSIHGMTDLHVTGCGGTVTLLARIKEQMIEYDRNRIERTVLNEPDLDRLVEQLWRCRESERKRIVGLPPEKADVILMGSLIYQCILRLVPCQELRISMRGLRFGALIAG